ncbi:MAG: glutathione S-transferase family protein [Roseovarius sp.]|nr:glutathione S-transferase family protein [Roseovarius sp.]MCY4316285.1 glutathione S-transferase family protein [Roseovarius sp.]
MLLYFAPNSRAVRTAWLLFELDLEFDIQRHKLGDKSMRTPEFRSINPNGRVPVLDDGGTRITESTAIAQYLVARYGNGKFAPDASSPEFPVYLQWLHYGEGMIMGPMSNYVVETLFLPPERRSDEHAGRAFKLMARSLEAVESHMEGREYLAGDFTAADTITGHACMMCARFGVDLSSMPNVEAYVRRLTSRPALIKAREL